ncbi:serine protease [Archaeoglobales archaeon]|nr:MAG: serine protease [Archaeoglobales archaeon]
MPTWGEILRKIEEEFQKLTKLPPEERIKQPHPCDAVRRKYLVKLYQKTGRNVILYATKWSQPSPYPIPPGFVQIHEEDVHGFMEVIHGLEEGELDLILHNPGGDPGATEALISYLRKKFENIRVIIPQAAMSAATMLACAANKIVMGKHSSLGPIDPQLILQTSLGWRSVPAEAILEQFRLAQDECLKEPGKTRSWLPILQQYGPALLIEAKNAIDLSQELVHKWLREYMFKGDKNAEEKAKEIANFLSNYQYFKSHSRHINVDQAKELGLYIEELEKDQEFQDLVLSVFHATMLTFDRTPSVKIIENHQGRAFIKRYSPTPLPQPQQKS